MIYIPGSQKRFLKRLGKSASGFVRSLISDQMKDDTIEISEVKQKLARVDAEAKMLLARLKELEGKKSKSQNVIILRQDILEQQSNILVETLKEGRGNLSEIDNSIKFIVKSMNEKLNGSDGHPVTFEELKKAVINRAKIQGVEVY